MHLAAARPCRAIAAFTLVEMLIAIAVVALIVTLAAPSFRDMILMQRLRGTNAQLVTDLSYARSEAVSRAQYVQVRFQKTAGAAGMSCYVIYTRTDRFWNPLCDCLAAEGSRCPTPALATEVRTVQVANSSAVHIAVPSGASIYLIDPRTGGLVRSPVDSGADPVDNVLVDGFIDDSRKFRNRVGISGRVSVCVPSPSTLGGDSC
ncbi:MAG: GspH/FimT family pseudopilin [Rubrivivax sp.]|nr:GspH/FimT family pseudopilin [Rubrivivax sp.]